MPGKATRRELLWRGVAAGGVGSASPEIFSASRAAAAVLGAQEDTGLLRFLLGVELLTVFVYQHVLASGMLAPVAHRLASSFIEQEQAHVRALSTAMNQRGAALPAGPADLPAADKQLAARHVSSPLGQLRDGRDALHLLIAVEEMDEGAYFAAMSRLSDVALLRLGAQIMANEAQHAAILREVLHPRDITMAVPVALVQGTADELTGSLAIDANRT